ncbi:MAG: class I SAM-dependent methyltransferase [Desulfobacterales bacterium]
MITNTKNHKKSIISHYQKNDPHASVAFAKKGFFYSVLDHLVTHSGKGSKKILDVGCGYGYFLKLALESGLEPNGVELSENAAAAAKLAFGPDKIFHGELRAAVFADDYFDAITLWDVLVMMENPHKELEECHRILKTGGIIGIRVRNVIFQKLSYYIQRPFQKIYQNLGIKNPTVFHPFCFAPRSIELLLRKLGFTNIQIVNSPLTFGDPYGYCGLHFPIQLVKTLIQLISLFIFSISRGRWIMGPSLLVWAEKS